MQVAPVIIIPVLVILAQFAVVYATPKTGNFSLPMTMLAGFPYRVEPLFPAAVAVILGFGLWRYTGMGMISAVTASLLLFLLPFAASYLLAYYIAVHLPFQITSVADYSNALLSLRPAVEGVCRLLVLAVCAPTFRSLSAWLLILACWSGATVLLLFAYLDEVVAASYPTLVEVATVLGFAAVGYQFPRAPKTW
ncbi:MAG TPA: hypothetical protein VN802_01750 [Stellaceae bacterium]|nr:hypothetical protein [Stellaceae bacterium]